MTTRKNTFLLKRSNVPGKVPSPGDLQLGELALNTSDAILYTSGTTANQILPIGWDRLSTLSGGTVNGDVTINGFVSATTYYNLPTFSGEYLPLSGGTVYGNTIFTSGLTANTLTVEGLTQTSGITSTGGITFKQVTINSSYTATTSDYMIDVTGGTFSVVLPSAVGIQGRLLVVKNNGGGAVTVQPVLGQNIDDKPFVILGETNTIQLVSNGSNWVAISYNISTVNSSTGVFEFTGLTKVSATTFNVAPIKGWIVDDTTNPLSPQLYYIDYSGGTHTDNYVNTDFETFVYLTLGNTIAQQPIPLTEQQRRQNIFLGKLGHPDKTSINLVFSQPDFVLSPLAQLRDMFVPINLINGGVVPSTNGTNLKFNTNAGYIHGLGINFTNDILNPNTVYIPGTNPCTFQYRTQTGGTVTNVTDIDPLNYDVGGVITPVTGTKATNQRIYLLQNGSFRVMYGQTTYNTLALAIEALQTESFTPFPNFVNNAVLIGILTVLTTATDLTDTSKARFFFASKFGETVGAAGGTSTTNLQQAYNNSSNPEIITNTIQGGVQFKGGTGNDNDKNIIIENNAGTETAYIRSDGFISGSSLNAPNLTISGGTQSIFLGNSSSDLVRITQTGSGNAFVVEDSTNPDTTSFAINGSGIVGVGVNPSGWSSVISQPYVGMASTGNRVYVSGNLIAGGDKLGIGYYNSTNPFNITNVISGNSVTSSFGSLLESYENGQFVIGIRDNDPNDGFNILSHNGGYTGTSEYSKLIATFKGSGKIGLGGIKNPTEVLEVSGNTYVSGEITTDSVVTMPNFKYIQNKNDFPTAIGGIITLSGDTTYFINTTVDLTGDRLVAGQNTTILGGSSENSRLKSTGLSGTALLSSAWSIPMRGLTIESDVALNLDAGGNANQAIDWFGINFTNCNTIGLIKDYSNIIWTDCAILESANLTFSGTIATIGFSTCLFNGISGKTIFNIPSGCSITRRFRPIYSSFIVLPGETGITISNSAIVNNDGFILDTINFAGGGTYISGLDSTSVKSLFSNNVGILNSSNVGHYYMINNTTNTTIGVPNVNVWVKAAGTTTVGVGNSPRWIANGNNRLDYTGNTQQDFKFTAVGTVQSASVNQVISVGLAINGTIQTESEITVRTATANQPYPFAIQELAATLSAGAYIEVFVLNTNSADIRVGDLNVIIDKISV